MLRRVLLVVELDPATSRVVRRAVEGRGVEVVPAVSLEDALDLVAQRPVDVVLSGLTLTGGSGYDLARRLGERYPATRVFLLWGGLDVLDGERARRVGARSLRRPLSAEALRASLEVELGSLHPLRDDLEEDLPVTSIEPLETEAPRRPLVGTERLATFVPNDYEALPPLKLEDRGLVLAVEQAVMTVLPEVVEAVLRKALLEPGRVRNMVERTVARAVEEQLAQLGRQDGTPPTRDGGGER